MSPRTLLGLAGVTLLVLLASACGGGDDEPEAQRLDVVVASYELVANTDNRFIAGVLTPEQQLVTLGEVDMAFAYLGTGQSEQEPEPYSEATAHFLPLPGSFTDTSTDSPKLSAPSEGAGVYELDAVNFDRAGFWQVVVSTEIDGAPYAGVSAFQVLEETAVPAPGEQAIASENYVIGSDVAPQAIDSRAQSMDSVPDAALHEKTIAEALEEDKPLVIVFSTPVFCVSRFCGPITEMVTDVAAEYGEAANFIHIEIWEDFQGRKITPTAGEWLYRNDNLQEPWVFVVDADGTITNRWDNVVSQEQIEAALDSLTAS